MTITREITRADFVKQPDGSVNFCVEVTEMAPDPFEKRKVLRRVMDPAPMTEAQAQELGFSAADIVAQLNADAVKAVATLTEQLNEANRAKADAIAERDRAIAAGEQILSEYKTVAARLTAERDQAIAELNGIKKENDGGQNG